MEIKTMKTGRSFFYIQSPPSVSAGGKVIQYRLIDNFDIQRPAGAVLVYEQFKLVGKRQTHRKLLLAFLLISNGRQRGTVVLSVPVTSGSDSNDAASRTKLLALIRIYHKLFNVVGRGVWKSYLWLPRLRLCCGK